MRNSGACDEKDGRNADESTENPAEHWPDNVSKETETRIVAHHFALYINRCFASHSAVVIGIIPPTAMPKSSRQMMSCHNSVTNACGIMKTNDKTK